MSTRLLEPHTVRLHPELWDEIERDARRLRLKPTDYLRRRIEDAFSFVPDVPKTSLHVRKDDIVEIPA